MKKIFLTTFFLLILLFTSISTQANTLLNSAPSISASAYNPFRYYLFLDYKPQGFFTTKTAAFAAAANEIKRQACQEIQILDNTKEIYFKKQYSNNRVTFLPWQVEINPGCKAIYLDTSWEGDAEIALIDPTGKMILQKDFGKKYPNILSYYANQGNDIVILKPTPGIWKVWVLGHFRNALIDVPHLENLYIKNLQISHNYPSLTMASYWENEFLEDLTPAKLFLADNKGMLYLMQSYNPSIISELTGYNGLAMQILYPHKGNWKIIAITTRSEITNFHFTVFDTLPYIQGQVTKLTYAADKKAYQFYWQATSSNFPKVLFISATPWGGGDPVNLILPLTQNPQIVPASLLPKYFSYAYYLSSSFGMGDDGLLSGPPLSASNNLKPF